MNLESIIDDSLQKFGLWLSDSGWRGKEHDCVNAFAHGFLMNHMSTSSSLSHPAQICIECGLKQPGGYERTHARRDLVIWEKPFQNYWNDEGEREHTPLAFMEWKAKRVTRIPERLFFPHDEEWVSRYTLQNPDSVGYVVAAFFLPDRPAVFWKACHNGVFTAILSSPEQ